MARIRSIKPDYWKSESIARLSLRARLTFIGLWSYVDDNGVGRDSDRLITAELYPLEDDPREALAMVREDLDELSRESRIVRYEVSGKRYVCVTGWDEHQKIDRPGKARYPRPEHRTDTPPSGLTSTDTPWLPIPAEPSRQFREGLAQPHAPEQGAGSREEGAGIPPEAARDDAPTLIDLDAPTPPRTAQTLVAEWIDHCGERPPGRVIGQVSKELGLMLTEGVSFHDVRVGLQAWHGRGLHPSALASVVHEQRTAAQRVRSSGRMSPGERLLHAAALGDRLQAEDDADHATPRQIGASL